MPSSAAIAAEQQRLRGQPRDGAARAGRAPGRSRGGGRVRLRPRGPLRTIATSAAMIPFASAGRSASSSSSSGLSIRSSGVGSSAVTDADARLGHERRQLPDRRAGPERRQRLVAAVHAQPAGHDGVQVVLDRALLDDDARRPPPRPRSPAARAPRASGPGRPRTGATRWSATTRSIVDIVMR